MGAGIGTNTELLLERHENIKKWVCLEPDESLAQQIKYKFSGKYGSKLECHAKYLSDLGTQQKFDSILYIDVIEHIENDYAEMERAKKVLKPGGFLIVLVPAQESLYSEFDKAIGHYRRYNKKRLQEAIGLDLKKKKLMYLDALGMFASMGNKWLLKQNYPTEKQIKFWDSTLLPLSKPLDSVSFNSTGKTLLGIWQSKE